MEFWRRKKKKGKARKCFLRNGSMFLEKLIADCNGISIPIRMFSFDQISKATSPLDLQPLVHDSDFHCVTGVIEGRSYMIKICTGKEEMAYNNTILSARVSNHCGFLKLIGCCLQIPRPVLVYEDLGYTVMNERETVGSLDAPLLPWSVRLKIAKEIAIAITYLHTAFPRIIIHRDIKPTNVFLDKNGKARLSDLSLAIALPEGKSWILDDTVKGTFGYLDLNYLETILVTEYLDVFSFGTLMLVLLMGRPAILASSSGVSYSTVEYVSALHEREEPVKFGGDSNDMKPDQMRMFFDLALRCCDGRIEDRPKMIMVAKEIKLIEQGSYFSEMLENVSGDGQISDQIMFHQQIITNCRGIINHVRMFSSNQIFMATSHFDPMCSIVEDMDTYFTWYKGDIQGRPCATKRYTEPLYVEEDQTAYNDIVMSARVSNHNGFLKLIGCCLEFPRPVLVFEDLDYRVLNERGTVGSLDAPLLPWNVRLKIAKDVAIAITYLHTAFSRIINMHRDIKVENVFLDENGMAKLTDLSSAITLPKGKSWIKEPVVVTYGYTDPTYSSAGILTTNSDVFSFGIFMLVLLMGRQPYLVE
ncbi:hypothetical protein Bca52824_077623 [Brassica carinata]|uniref:Protein kinase domain-containing protein n=1 Tax=Brassica carinata TaxID=52824 RepID=A0A8X7TYD6_BRACI|nr:hypothetical protein Bca52824_077623 [Brassica carinata]